MRKISKNSNDQLAATRRMVQTSLDILPEGSPDLVEEQLTQKKAQRGTLPEGLTSKMLYRDVMRIAWPSLVELLLSSLVSMVDMMMVGGLGTWAISAVGLATQPRFLFMNLVMAVNVGATAMIARARGAGDHLQANKILKQAMFLSFIMSIIGTVAGYFLSEPMIRFMANSGMSEQVIYHGTKYLEIQMLGFGFSALTMTITATLRGTGNSKLAMIYNLVANLVNVMFNYLFINGNLGFPRLEVAGASLATIIGQAVAFFMAMYSVMNGKNYLKLELRGRFIPDKDVIKGISQVGLPALGEQLIMRVGMIIFGRTVATLGEISMATHQVCMNIQSISFMNGQAFAVSATSLVGQSLGKKRPDMAEHYSTRCRRLGMSVSVFMTVVFVFFGTTIVGFYNKDLEVLRMGAIIMLFVATIQPIQSSQFVLSGALRGAGDTRVTAIITLITVLIIRPVIAELGVNVFNWGLIGAWVAIVLDQCVRSGLVLARYNSRKWMAIKIAGVSSQEK